MKKLLLIILIFFSICVNAQIYERKIPYDYSKISSWMILSRKHGDTISLADFYVAHRDGTLIGYYTNGKIACVLPFKKGKPYNSWHYFDTSGKLIMRYDFRRGYCYFSYMSN